MEGARERLGEMGQRLQEGWSDVGERLHEGYDSAREGMAHGYRRAEGVIARHPSESVLLGFGVGVGLGMLLGVLLTQRESSWYERHVPDSLRNLPDRLRGLHLPDAIARHLPG